MTARRPKLDADLERSVRRIERMPLRVVAFGFLGAGGMLGIDWVYNHQLTAVAWIAVVGIATVTIPLTGLAKWHGGVFSTWAADAQARREQPQLPPEHPSTRPTTRPRTSSAASPAKPSRASLTPIPDDPPKKARSTT